ncbi:MAG: hypothetical protein R2816_00665 [Flavobacteriaceae bacterium]
MKNKLLIFLTITFFVLGANAQNTCSKYYPTKKGTAFQMKVYDKKDNLSTTIDYSILDSKTTGSNQTATIEALTRDDKDKLITTVNYDISCDGDKLSIDFNSLINPQIYEQYKDMEIEVSGTNIELPNKLSIGQNLPDADVLMNIKVTPINMKLSVVISNRKVEAKETITTPAGTFECFVISYEMDLKMGFKQNMMAKDWISEGIGLVQSQSFNKNGKQMSRTILTQFSK